MPDTTTGLPGIRDETSVAILLLVHTVATRGGEGQVAGVKVERLDQDGTTPTMRHLAWARGDLAAQERITEELRGELGAKIKLTQAQARVIERVRALHRSRGIYDECGFDDVECEHEHIEADDDPGLWLCTGLPLGAQCNHCRDEDGERLPWPCPTIAALDGGKETGHG